MLIQLEMHFIISEAKPDPFFWFEPDLGPKIWVESGWPSLSKNGSNWVELASSSNWVQIWVQPYNVFNKLDFGSGLAPGVQIRADLGWVGTPGSKFGLSQIRLVGFI
jgi:hypothetical protein